MCGRFALYHSEGVLGPLFDLPADEVLLLEPRYNIAPSQGAAVIRSRAGGPREMLLARWGLLPHWADPATFKANLFNARSETAAEKPSFREAMRRGRCLIPASGFFEWKQDSSPKLPHFVRRSDGRPLAFAGLWSVNTRGDTPVLSCSVLTTRPSRLMASLHRRMPVILDPADYERWLDVSIQEPEMLADLLVPCPDEGLEAYPVGRAVGNPAVDEASLVEPIVS